MIPLLAPLLGSLAGSLLPASVGTGIAGALGLKGAAAGLVAAAAPKAIGAGIGTLLAGGDLGDAALNAIGFGAGSALSSQLLGAGVSNAGAVATSPRPMLRPEGLAARAAVPAPVSPVVPTGASQAAISPEGLMDAASVSPVVPTGASQAAISPEGLMDAARQFSQLTGQQQQRQAAMPMPAVAQSRPPSRASENPMLTALAGPAPDTASMLSMPATVPSVGGALASPSSMGIGSLSVQGQQPMSNDMMLAGMSPNQSDMVSQYLRSQNMVGFV